MGEKNSLVNESVGGAPKREIQIKCLPLALLTILEENVEQDDADFVIRADISIQQDGHNGPHGVFDLFSLGVCAHSQILRQTNMHDLTQSQKRSSTK